ncbi:hypothetical protein ABL78_4556 [Leptomonas seymouri]|uniref:Uncharacterized protein n=1 Tax=Leptomonas seymouri TaxID=5684 RepID=A0A0N1PBX1_LEPSE|nr:hypothetical protein ABL78_4556 [Leptomonas seymouri]|eukprot:KPI86370.1 hypothetical protein ABL78_4556 [Leptomonas seymouri]
MSQRITPLTRNQLLELEALVRNLITIVTQQQQQQLLQRHHHQTSNTTASVGNQSWPSSASSTPASLTATAGKSSSLFPPSRLSEPSAFADLSSSNSIAEAEAFSSCHGTQAGATCLTDHPVLHGTFIDVFTDPLTATSWRLYDKILYIVWWSYRLPSCTSCGMQDAWMPSGDVEFKCSFCIAGAGTTRSNAVVEDEATVNEDAEYGNDSGDEDDVDEKEKANEGGGGGGPGGGPIDAYLFFYEWLRRIPVLSPAGASAPASDAHNVSNGVGFAGHDTGSPQRLSAVSRGSGAASSSMNGARGGGRSAQGPSLPATSATTSSASSSVLLPSGEALPTVLRAAYDMSCLLTAPGLPRGTAPVIRAACLYMSLLLHRYVSLFPLFCTAGRESVAGGGKTMASAQPPSRAGTFESSEEQLAEVELQWIDVELVCALLGVAAPSFFESTEVSVQHLQNVFTVAATYGVPSVLWHPGRVPGRVEIIKALKDKVIPLCPLHSTTAGVSGLCPEHTAMIVALELARRVDAHSIAASSTSPAAAAQNAQRIGMWLDALGLYPTRRVYRDVHSFQRAMEHEEASSSGDAERRVKEEEEEAEGKGRGNDTMREWEKTLTELSAVNDPHLIAAAERHAHRHDSLAAALDPGGSKDASSPYLTTQRSPFFKCFEWILTSPCANALLHVFAAVFRLTPMELADAALRSGIYQGHASGFVTTLRTAVQRGAFDIMPLARRLSPVTSSWMSVYMALHSSDRLPLLAALFQFNDGQNSSRDRQAALTRLLQKILRKHQAAQLHQLNYVLRVTDEDEKHFNGVYFLSSVLWQEGLAVFTCLRSGRKTITMNRFAGTMSLCYMNAKEKIVSRLSMHVVSPVVAAVETDAARLVMEVALGAVARGVSTHGDPWGTVVRCLDRCARVRRRMRVPMLASRLDALASIRENVGTVVRRFQQLPSLHGVAEGGGGGGAMVPTLLGWGETETLLAAAPQLDVRELRRDLQWNILALPNVSLLSGLSENRVVAMYASLVGILELIHDRLTAGQASSSPAALLNNWVEELLFVEEEEVDAACGFVDDFGGPLSVADHRRGPGWSPPMYRNSRGGTPKLSRSPKSKFISVSTSTNTAGSSAPTSAFTTTYANSSSHYTPTPPQGFARQPYTLTPPSMAPSRSPALHSVAATATVTTPPLSSVRAPREGWKGGSNDMSASALAPSTSSSSHNAVSTPISRFQAPSSASSLGKSGNGTNRTPPLSHTAGEARHGEGCDVLWSGKLPELELSASTADVEKQLSSGSKTGQQQMPPRRSGRRREREDGDQDGHDEDGDDGSDRDEGRAQQERVLRLLRQILPPYWDVLLGLATDLALPNAVTAASPAATARSGVRGDALDDEDEEGVNGGENHEEGDGARRMAAHARERRLRRQQHHSSQQHCGGSSDPKARASAATARQCEKDSNAVVAVSRSALSAAHRPFNLFDAEECRRRLHRLYVFVSTYIQCKQRYQEQAAAGTLPTLPEKTAASSPPPPLTPGASCKPPAATATTGSPPPSVRGVGGAKASTAAAAGVNSSGLRSPRAHLTPPPPYNSLAGPQRSPPYHQRSPRQPSPRGGHPQPSPPHSPELRNGNSNIVSGAPRLSRQSGGVSPVPRSPSLTAASRKSGAEGGNDRSPKQQSSMTPPMRSSPPQHGKRTSGTAKSHSGGHGQRSKGGLERTAVALVDDENFSLPPSEVAWAHNGDPPQHPSRAERASGTGTTDSHSRKGTEDRPSSRYAASPLEGHRARQQQQRWQAAVTSTTSSDTEIDEETLTVTASVQQTSSSRKRMRDGSEGHAGEEDKDDDYSSGGGDVQRGQQPPQQQQQQQQQLRRKAKKLGRRRRRQEQSAQQFPQQPDAKAPLPSPSSRSSGKEPSRSPELRSWRDGKVTGSVSPLGNSPALPPRRSGNADPSGKPKPRMSSPPQSTVPSIRGRTARASEEAAAASDSERSADCDAEMRRTLT